MLYQRKQSLEAANEHSVFLFGARQTGKWGGISRLPKDHRCAGSYLAYDRRFYRNYVCVRFPETALGRKAILSFSPKCQRSLISRGYAPCFFIPPAARKQANDGGKKR